MPRKGCFQSDARPLNRPSAQLSFWRQESPPPAPRILRLQPHASLVRLPILAARLPHSKSVMQFDAKEKGLHQSVNLLG